MLHAGTRQLSVTFTPTDLAHYAPSTKTVSLEVTKAPLIVTANPATKVYGTANPASAVTYGGFVSGDGPSSLGGTLAFATAATTASPAGSYPVTPSGLTSSDYSFTFEAGSLTVNKAVLTVTVANKAKSYGAAVPALTSTTAGFVNGDAASVVTGTATLSTIGTAASTAGTYPINGAQGTLAAANYTFTFVPGVLTVNTVQPDRPRGQRLEAVRLGQPDVHVQRDRAGQR